MAKTISQCGGLMFLAAGLTLLLFMGRCKTKTSGRNVGAEPIDYPDPDHYPNPDHISIQQGIINLQR